MENLDIRRYFLSLLVSVAFVSGSKVRNVYWNTTTASFSDKPMIVTVNEGNLPWEYDQLNLICPWGAAGEEHVIYSVDREEFEGCRVRGPRPRIVAVCNSPERFMYFTITFRSFTPTPGGLEFRPGQEYYFISTANKRDIHRRVGGWCSSHNMKMIVRVAESEAEREHEAKETTFSPIPSPAAFWANFKQRNTNLKSDHYNQRGEETYFKEKPGRVLEFRDESVDISITGRSLTSHSSKVITSSVFFYTLLLSLSWTLAERL